MAALSVFNFQLSLVNIVWKLYYEKENISAKKKSLKKENLLARIHIFLALAINGKICYVYGKGRRECQRS